MYYLSETPQQFPCAEAPPAQPDIPWARSPHNLPSSCGRQDLGLSSGVFSPCVQSSGLLGSGWVTLQEGQLAGHTVSRAVGSA